MSVRRRVGGGGRVRAHTSPAAAPAQSLASVTAATALRLAELEASGRGNCSGSRVAPPLPVGAAAATRRRQVPSASAVVGGRRTPVTVVRRDAIARVAK
ncbi:hypothetical protein HK405_013180, partial [Cladochytrium tenue]